ncbi:hypothetical protein Lesp02_74470 [Lentzea sp. NBRC 105346]|uniref:hypothetical protein n=1 Tax=Lentzea sp. NBRC 105346 TaxID=3032205 RepID=UPI0024A0F6C9|nr:hypothetical protein [Lentzea sp. NBRC 105346]GLZ35260.1 hypothetical protein Lesp02_74470 [Lentzea sp. NBRC 105346]
MSTDCGPEAEAVTRGLGFDCHDVAPVVSVRAPWDLAHWTMPLLELIVIGGAVFALVHAVRRYRAGDPVNLALWWASLVYLFVTEPPLYFPEWFGLDRIYGFIFAHNQFTVQFMWDRLPLYIVAFYPMITGLAYEVVRSLGIFRRSAAAGAVTVAFVCQLFYEVFDHIGPQLKWWAWNPDNHIVNHPALESVPMTSMLLFASVSLGALTYLVVRLVQRSLAMGLLVAGVLTPPTMAIAGIPSSLFEGNTTAQAWVIGIELALVWLAGAWIISKATPEESLSAFARWYPPIYLGGLAVCWIGALPVPIGSGLYALACFIGAGAVLTVLNRRRAPVPARG